MKKLNIGIVGAGRIGKVHAASITYNIPQAQVVRVTDVVEEAAKALPEGSHPGLLATSATAKTGIYTEMVKRYGFDLILPDDDYQLLYMAAITDVKAGRVPDKGSFELLLEHLRKKGADIFILGCTEIPLAFEWLDIKDPAVDATEALAKAAIHFCGKKVREIKIH